MYIPEFLYFYSYILFLDFYLYSSVNTFKRKTLRLLMTKEILFLLSVYMKLAKNPL